MWPKASKKKKWKLLFLLLKKDEKRKETNKKTVEDHKVKSEEGKSNTQNQMLVQGRKWCKERRFRQGIVYFIPYSEEKALKERQTKPWTLMQENTLWNPTLTTHVYACFSLLSSLPFYSSLDLFISFLWLTNTSCFSFIFEYRILLWRDWHA